ncbi:MAG: hypothetical protein WCJ80_12100, partial [Bacteroidota bacterium]
ASEQEGCFRKKIICKRTGRGFLGSLRDYICQTEKHLSHIIPISGSPGQCPARICRSFGAGNWELGEVGGYARRDV